TPLANAQAIIGRGPGPGPGWLTSCVPMTLPDESSASTIVPTGGGVGVPAASTATPATGAISSVVPDGRRRRTVLTPGPVWTAAHMAGEFSATPNMPVTTWESGAEGDPLARGTNPWPTAASLDSSARRDGVGLHWGKGWGHSGRGDAVKPLVGVAGELALAELLAPLDAKADADPFDTLALEPDWPGWPEPPDPLPFDALDGWSEPDDEETPAS